MHCCSHVLNLAISSGCTGVPSIRNLFDSIHKLTWFLSGSAKQKEILLETDTGTEGKDLLDVLTVSSDEADCISESTAAIKKGKNCAEVLCYSLDC